jgi:fumarylacetoacetase
MLALNETHDPGLRSWLRSANAHVDFPIQNLPFSVFRRRGEGNVWRGGVAIGDQVLDVGRAVVAGGFAGAATDAAGAAAERELNRFMALGSPAWSALRLALSRGLREGSACEAAWRDCLVPQADVEYRVPARIGDYTDFYTSIHHATSVGRLFRPDNPLLPNYRWVPIGYHGRVSTIGVSGQAFRRPKGQLMVPGARQPELGASRRMDYELELGIFVGGGNEPGRPIDVTDAEDHVFGLCLLNDWSSRDIQSWEYQPLGPFLSKNFATTLSPWIVTAEALEPFRAPWSRTEGEPEPLAYLDSPTNREKGGIDIRLEVSIETQRMRDDQRPAAVVSRTSFRHAYWTVAQMVAHHTVNGCQLKPGDLFGSGTQSGPEPSEAGSLLELSKGGQQPLQLDEQERRTFLEDGDAVIFRGWCERKGATRIGFGEARGTLLPA